MKHIMIDIETLSTKPNAAILSFAAVRFDIETGNFSNHIYRRIKGECNEKYGRHICTETVYWWLKQNNKSIVEAFAATPRMPLEEALLSLTEFVVDMGDGVIIWANSPSFDLIILKSAYEQLGLKEPWDFWQERDVRTISSLNETFKAATKNKKTHNPIEDCRHQIEYLSKNFQWINR